MDYYSHHIGDFNNATRHLTPVQRSLYRDAIEMYYDTEKPLITDIPKLARLMLATTNKEIDALKVVLDEFFELKECGYFHGRCAGEIELYQLNQSQKSDAGKASGRARRKIRDERSARSTNVEQKPESVELTSNHEPVTMNHSISGNSISEFALPKDVPTKEIIDMWNAFATRLNLYLVVKPAGKLLVQLRERWVDIPTLKQWGNFFETISKSEFLTGKLAPGQNRTTSFKASLLYVTEETNFSKIAAGEFQ